jgi:hypothetical protein
MSQDIRDLLGRLTAIAESDVTPAAVKSGLNAQQRRADQLPALFRPHHIDVLKNPTDPQHPMKGKAVGSLEERMGEIEEDMVGKIRRDLNDYLRDIEQRVHDDGRREKPHLQDIQQKDQLDKDLVDKAKQEVEDDQVEEAPGTSPTKRKLALANMKAGEDLHVGDEVIVTGPVKYQGSTGVIDELGRQNMFAVVNLYNHGRVSFQASDLEINDYAGSEEEEAELNRYGEPDPGLFGDDDRDDDSDKLAETIALEDGSILTIHGSPQSGFGIRRGDRAMPSRFDNVADARMAVDLFRAQRRERNRGEQPSDNQDYVEER